MKVAITSIVVISLFVASCSKNNLGASNIIGNWQWDSLEGFNYNFGQFNPDSIIIPEPSPTGTLDYPSSLFFLSNGTIIYAYVTNRNYDTAKYITEGNKLITPNLFVTGNQYYDTINIVQLSSNQLILSQSYYYYLNNPVDTLINVNYYYYHRN